MVAVVAAPAALPQAPSERTLSVSVVPTNAAASPSTPDASQSAPDDTRRSSATSEGTAPSGAGAGRETAFMSCYLAALQRCEARYSDPFQRAQAAPAAAVPLATTKLRILCPDQAPSEPRAIPPSHAQCCTADVHPPPSAWPADAAAAPLHMPVIQAAGPYVCAQPMTVATGSTLKHVYIVQPTATGPVLAPAHAPPAASLAETRPTPVSSPKRAAKRLREAALPQGAPAESSSPSREGSPSAPCKLCSLPTLPGDQGVCGCGSNAHFSSPVSSQSCSLGAVYFIGAASEPSSLRRDCCEYQRYAKRLGYRMLDVRQAIHAGAIGLGKLLTQDAFHAVMKAFMSGDFEAGGKHELQAGARAERMSKRNRGRPVA